MYTDLVMDHFTNPRNVGEIEDADGVGQIGNPVCGDVMRISIAVDDKDQIADVKFKTFGCGAAVATSSMVTEMVMGKSLAEAGDISNKAVAEALGGLPPNKMHCSNLAADALHLAIQDFLVKSGREAEAEQILGVFPKGREPSSP
jgi:nitrogen fixation NifU-like protein